MIKHGPPGRCQIFIDRVSVFQAEACLRNGDIQVRLGNVTDRGRVYIIL